MCEEVVDVLRPVEFAGVVAVREEGMRSQNGGEAGAVVEGEEGKEVDVGGCRGGAEEGDLEGGDGEEEGERGG